MMKPPNSKTTSMVIVPAVTEATTVWQTEAMNRNMDTEVTCMINKRRNWRKNLKKKLVNMPEIPKQSFYSKETTQINYIP